MMFQCCGFLTCAFSFYAFSQFSTEGVKAKVYFKAVPTDEEDGLTFLRVEETKMDFSVKNIQMGVDNVAGGNPVIRELNVIYPQLFVLSNIPFYSFSEAALNLFINSNAQELLKEMKPALRNKLNTVLHTFIDHLFERIPLEHFLN